MPHMVLELTAKLGYPLANMLGLKFKIFFVIKADLTHLRHLDSSINNTNLIISQIYPIFNRYFNFFRIKFFLVVFGQYRQKVMLVQ